MAHAYSLHTATPDDMDILSDLMHRSITELQADFLTPEQITASFECMGIDTQLIRDASYFYLRHRESGIIGACGGWSMRETLFGGDHTTGRDPRMLDPASEPARVRAMYTHPDHIRRGLGKAILDHCENAARQAGFTTCSLAGTLAGEPLYQACGYKTVEQFTFTASNGIIVPLLHMEKSL